MVIMSASQALKAGSIPATRSILRSPSEVQANLAQLVEQCFRKAEVPGSIPGIGSRKKIPSTRDLFYTHIRLTSELHFCYPSNA